MTVKDEISIGRSEVEAFGGAWLYTKPKSKGANFAGHLGGGYIETTASGRQIFVKREDDGAKSMAEYVTAQIMQAVSPKLWSPTCKKPQSLLWV